MKYGMLFLTLFLATACGRAVANSARAEVIPAPMAGYTCFVVYGPDGTAVGGNCVKE